MGVLVSVIVPVYNTELYLMECVRSILCQTYANIEVILVDDGSTDLSGKICDEFAERDNRVHTFHRKNSGVGATRNFGISVASGKYILFVDSDDLCRNNMIEKFLEAAMRLPDKSLVVCSIGVFSKTMDIKRVITKGNANYSITDYLEKIVLKTKIGQFCGGPYNKLFLKEIIDDNKLLFEPDMNYAEDFCFNMKYLKYIDNVMLLEDDLYLYRENTTNSLTFRNYHNFNKERYWEQRKKAFQAFESTFLTYNLVEKNKKVINELLIRFIISTIKMTCKFSKDRKEAIGFISKVCQEPLCKERINDVIGLSCGDKIRKILIKYRLSYVLFWLETTRYGVAQILWRGRG